ncbi:hypothetical protein [Mongoliitalea lutea]|uniref:Uncharacterized protein n=1 Tax=Mongoliitalea lutea TaxID=849756 RepID=A0A8J3CZJ8_9BACT|nr:hypothetical protein [Mongoliitalea lutea]GHB44385.1 hypothetical protein GCM10008106_26810 [Mongoliitalea lutea]
MAASLKNIILLSQGEKREVWTSLVLLCDAHPEFSYHYIKKYKFPFEYKGWFFEKQPVNVKSE